MTIAGTRSADLDQYGDNELLTMAEVATILRAPLNSLRYWRHLGTGPRFFKVGRQLVTTVADVKAWIEEQKNRPQPGVA